MCIQIVLVLIFTFRVFDIPSRGPFVLVILLLIFQGATGMAFGSLLSSLESIDSFDLTRHPFLLWLGLVVSAFCKQENTAVMMILGSFYPNLILSGTQ